MRSQHGLAGCRTDVENYSMMKSHDKSFCITWQLNHTCGQQSVEEIFVTIGSIMGWCLLNTTPLSKPVLTYFWPLWRKLQWNFNQITIIFKSKNKVAGLAQDCSNSIVNALELLQSCTKPWFHDVCGICLHSIYQWSGHMSQSRPSSHIHLLQSTGRVSYCLMYWIGFLGYTFSHRGSLYMTKPI